MADDETLDQDNPEMPEFGGRVSGCDNLAPAGGRFRTSVRILRLVAAVQFTAGYLRRVRPARVLPLCFESVRAGHVHIIRDRIFECRDYAGPVNVRRKLLLDWRRDHRR